MKRWLSLAAFGSLLVVAAQFLPHARPAAPLPAPMDEPGESDHFSERRQAWIESLHAHAPDVDWRAMDAQTRASLQADRALRASTNAPAIATSVPAGTWHEHGARNWAGRASDVDYDAATDRLTVFAHGGQLWRATRATLNWQPLNDARHFEPYYTMQHFTRLSGSPERWVAADDTQHGFFYSDDQGATWKAAGGFKPTYWLETTYLTARDVAGTQIYATVRDYNFGTSAYDQRLLVSADRGATYADLGFIGSSEKTALFAPGQGSALVYVLIGNLFQRIETNNTLTTITTIPGTPAQLTAEKVGLTSGVTSGTPFFFAFFESAGATQVFRSVDAGVTWQTRGTVPITAYIRMAAGTSLHDPNLAFFGGVNLYRSADGGLTFNTVNDWSAYYSNVAGKLHADISFVRTFADSLGADVFLVGTDGGLYQSTDGLLSVSNLSLNGLRQAQYYGSYTGRNPPYALSIGAQDQGYQRATHPSSGIGFYNQVISGDYAHLTSSDGGATLWMNYPTFTQLDPAAATGGYTLPSWQFSTDGNLQGMLFLPPLMADPSNAHLVWLGGGATTAGVNHVIALTWNGVVQYSGQVTSVEGTFDFGGQVTALAYSPQVPATRFAMAKNNTGASSFFRTSTPAATWTPTVTTLPSGQFFYGQAIVPDPVRANTIYVCGSGYSGHGVYVSADNGDSFVAMDTGLPNTLVYTLAISPDGANLFAATEVGPYYYDRANLTWVNIGAGAPDNIYWHVDYVPALHVARFSTYGRGVWDFDLGGGDLIFRDGLD